MEKIVAYGHGNITSKHKTAIEITKDKEISKRADCIIGVGADKGICDLSSDFKNLARKGDSVIKAVLRVEDLEEAVTGRGHQNLSFTHKSDFVLRKSNFVCPRTLMIKADKSSRDLDRDFVKLLENSDSKIEMRLYIYPEKS
ncbi:MAG: DUF371 domain-containing protein [Candidatus Hydrothermarchaeales archaeon]